MSRPFDVLVLGATGFTGRQVAHYLHEHAPKGLTWALAGRRPDALADIAAAVGGPPTRIVDTMDPASVDAAVKDTKVVITTVGPFAKYGTEVVRSCAEHGTDYVDITGETPWVREMIDRYQDIARESGACIVPFCGFDSVPSDLGAWLIARTCQDTLGQDCAWVKGAYSAAGGLNGGTLATVLHSGAGDSMANAGDPFLLNPPAHRDVADKVRHYDPRSAKYDEDLGTWTAPFMMGSVNTRVVRRSAALFAEQGESYGPDFAYQEYQKTSSRWKATAVTFALGAGLVLAGNRVGRKLLKTVGPSPGEGPSEKTMDEGWFKLTLAGAAVDGTRLRGVVSGQGDPGNRCTVRFLTECGLLLATQRDTLPATAGFWTPATALGQALVDVLHERGMTLEASA